MNISRIAVAGAGGIGSNLIHILYMYGLKRKQFNYASLEIDVYDKDEVDVKNLLHQAYTDEDLGKSKSKVMEDRYVVNGIEEFMTEKDFDKYDVIFSCVDNMPFRKSLYEWSWANPGKVFWIDGRCTSRQGATFNSDLPPAKLKTFLDDSTDSGGCLLKFEKEENISHTTPTTVASMMVQVFLNKLRGQRSSELIFMI